MAVNVPYLDTVLYLLGIPRADVEEADELSTGPDGQVQALGTVKVSSTA
jgi:hypothetical protein